MQTSWKTLLKHFALVLLACASGGVKADVTLDIDAADLRTSDGTLAPESTLVLLVASTSDSLFGSPTPTEFVTGDDVVLASWTLDSGLQKPGFFQKHLVLTVGDLEPFSGLSQGDPLRLYWYPTLTIASGSPGAGTSFGAYRPDPPTGLSGPWIFPTDPANPSGNFRLQFLTQSTGEGSLPDTIGNASFTVVPEPATYAVISALSCLGLGVFRKFRTSRA